MAKGHNQVILVGKVVSVPEKKGERARFQLNVPESRPGGEGEEWIHTPNVNWIYVHGKNADRAEKLKEGDRVMIVGETIMVPGKKRTAEGVIDVKQTVVRAWSLLAGGSDNLNQITLVGNLGKDPDIKYFESGNAVSRFSVATGFWDPEEPNDKGGKGVEKTVWSNIEIVSTKAAERAAEHLKKGSGVIVVGRLVNETWEKDGAKQSMVKIKAFDWKFPPRSGSGGDRISDGDRPDDFDGYFSNDEYGAETPSPAPNRVADMDEEIPF